MGFFGRLFGRYRPKPGVAPVPVEKLKADLLALNRPTAPFIIRECTANDPENADLVAEWRMREPNWYAAFGSANLSKSFQVFMRLLPDLHEVQSIDWTWNVTWSGGIPSFSYQKKGQRGLNWDYVFGIRPFYETTPSGERIAYRFSSSELKKPLHETVTNNGWSWRSRMASRLPRGSHAEQLRVEPQWDRRRKWVSLGAAFFVFCAVFSILSSVDTILKAASPVFAVHPFLSVLPALISIVVAALIAWLVAARLRRE
ncbi:MAG: hypothetical protein EPN45_18560 [Rhizobiaceae bacterium]|nr:MAG: hypothetical protein EPN45_18560 [Rhizobiaceae bacterium]